MTSSFDPGATMDAQSTPVPENPGRQGASPQRLQFSLSSLLILTALVAVGMVLLKNYGHWGLVAITAASFVFTFFALDLFRFAGLRRMATADQPSLEQIVASPHSATLRTLVDMIWGIGLPLLCFSYDPGILNREGGPSEFGDTVVFMALWQMALLLAWLVLGPKGQLWNGFMAGGMLVGTIMAALIAIPLTPLALIFSLSGFGYGLPGLVPLMTMCVFARNWIRCQRLYPQPKKVGNYGRLALASILLALIVPLSIVGIARSLDWPLHFPRVPNAEHLSLFD